MKRGNVYEENRRIEEMFVATPIVAASIIAAVRLAHGDISRPPQRVTYHVALTDASSAACLAEIHCE